MKTLARQIKHELNLGVQKHCAVYESELMRLWPLDQEEREAIRNQSVTWCAL